jgi:ankyrin repeat protein
MQEKPLLLQALDNNPSLNDIRTLLKQGADPNQADDAGRTPMGVALEHHWWEVAELLLAAGANPPPYKGDPNGPIEYNGFGDRFEIERETALTYYIKNGNWYGPLFDVISNGGDVNLANKAGETPMQVAVERSWPYVVTQLVKHGAWLKPENPDPDERVDLNTGATRLLCVIMEGRDGNAVKKILEEGADPNKTDWYGLTPLALARVLNWPYVEKLLIEHGANQDVSFPDPNQKIGDEEDTPLLCYAASYQNCHNAYLKALLDAGADPDAVDADGKAAVHWAAVYGKTWLFDTLQTAGADIFMPDQKYGLTPLHWSCMNGGLEIASRILEVCPAEAINQPYPDSEETPLRLAARRKGSAELLKVLIGVGAFVNGEDKHGSTPLRGAIGQRDPDMVRVLLESGADIDANPKEDSPLFSLANGPRDESPEIARLLLDHGANPNARSKKDINGTHKGQSLIHYAMVYASYKNFGVARAVLDAGADPHGTAANGESAMHYCLDLRVIEGVKLLLEYGFDPLKPFDYTQRWSGSEEMREERYIGSAYDHAKKLVEKFGHDHEYGQMLNILEAHLAAKKPASSPKKKAKSISP